jgi:hypothetical protein
MQATTSKGKNVQAKLDLKGECTKIVGILKINTNDDMIGI